MKIGQTGTFFRPGWPFELGEFIACRVLDILGEKLLVELQDGSHGEIQKSEFEPQYMVMPSNAEVTSRRDGWLFDEQRSFRRSC
jgi:hypothetical protein